MTGVPQQLDASRSFLVSTSTTGRAALLAAVLGTAWKRLFAARQVRAVGRLGWQSSIEPLMVLAAARGT